MNAIRSYLLSLTAAALLTSLVMALVPKGGVKRIAGVMCGLYMVLTALSPLTKLDAQDLSRAAAKAALESEEVRTGVAVQNQELQAAIISQTMGAYILDKAASLGLTLTAEVSVTVTPSGAFADAVTLTGDVPQNEKQLLTWYIEENLAIPEERQTWIQPGKKN